MPGSTITGCASALSTTPTSPPVTDGIRSGSSRTMEGRSTIVLPGGRSATCLGLSISLMTKITGSKTKSPHTRSLGLLTPVKRPLMESDTGIASPGFGTVSGIRSPVLTLGPTSSGVRPTKVVATCGLRCLIEVQSSIGSHTSSVPAEPRSVVSGSSPPSTYRSKGSGLSSERPRPPSAS